MKGAAQPNESTDEKSDTERVEKNEPLQWHTALPRKRSGEES